MSKPTPSKVVTIPPVFIEGDAASQSDSVRQLVNGYDSAKSARSCLDEGATASFGAVEVAGAAAGTLVAAAAGPLGIGAGLAAILGLSYSEGQKLRAFYDCETQ